MKRLVAIGLSVLMLVILSACGGPDQSQQTFTPDSSIRENECVSFRISDGHYVGEYKEYAHSKDITGTSLVWNDSVGAFVEEKLESVMEHYEIQPNGYGLWRAGGEYRKYAYVGEWNNGNAHGEGKYIEYDVDTLSLTRIITKCDGLFEDGKFIDGTAKGRCADILVHVIGRLTPAFKSANPSRHEGYGLCSSFK